MVTPGDRRTGRLEFLFEPGGFRRHDLPLFPKRPGGLLKREKGDFGERPHQLFFICKFLPRRDMESNGKCPDDHFRGTRSSGYTAKRQPPVRKRISGEG
jgi:hypothetical protein